MRFSESNLLHVYMGTNDIRTETNCLHGRDIQVQITKKNTFSINKHKTVSS